MATKKTKSQAKKKSTKSTKSAKSTKRVDELNKSIEKKKKAQKKKATHNPPKSDQNIAMDMLPSNRPAFLAANTSRPVTHADLDKVDEIEVTDNTLADLDISENPIPEKDPLENFASVEPEPISIDTENAKLTQDIALKNLEDSTDKPESTPAKTKHGRRILPKIIAIITFGVLAYLGYSVFRANVLPTLHLSIFLGILGLYGLLSLFKSFRRKTHTSVVVIFLILNLLISAAAGFAIFKINDTLAFFSKTLGLSDKEVSTYHLIVKKDSSKGAIEDVYGNVVHTQRDLVLGTDIISNAVREQLNASVAFSDNLDYLISLVTGGIQSTDKCVPTSSSSTSTSTRKTAEEQSAEDSTVYSEAMKCYYSALEDNNDPVIMLNSGTYDGIIADNSNFKDKTKIIGEVKIETNVEHVELNNITTKPFMIYISGIDTRTGTLPTRSLSDVNMVAVVNPSTRNLLLVSIPRDYYVHIAGTSKGALPDKLTHAGSNGGIQLSMATISELLDLDLEQYVRVNFNFVKNLVDTIGGINIYNDQNYSFSCWTNRECVFKPGYNYVYGDCALAFARERHAYERGDRHRGENQQQVIKLVLDKVTSSSTIISRYSEILDALVGTFETTLTQENITDLVKMHISDMTPWKVETYNLNGTTGMDKTYSYPTQDLSVMYPDQNTIEIAKNKIIAALEGRPTDVTSSSSDTEEEKR